MKKPKPGKLLSRVSALLTPRRASRRPVDAPALVVALAAVDDAEPAVHTARETMRGLEARLGELGEAKKGLDKSAAQAEKQIDAFFSELAQHKHDLAEGMRAVRKGACQPVADAANVCRVLERVARSTEAVKEEAEEEHVGLLLGGMRRSKRRVVLLEFVVSGGGTVRSALGVWKEACRLCILEDDKWGVHEDVPFEPMPDLSAFRTLHAAVVMPRSNTVMVVGGSVGGSVANDGYGGQPLNTIERLEPGADSWQAGPTFPTARKACGACVVGDEVIVVGGRTANNRTCNIVEAVNVVSGAHRTLPSLPDGVYGCGVVNVQGVVIVTGGIRFDMGPARKVWALDVACLPIQQQQQPGWTEMPEMERGRSFHGVAVGNDRVFVCAGGWSSWSIAECAMLTIRGGQAQGTWQQLPSLPNRAEAPGCCYGGGNLFVAGGCEPFRHGHREVFALNVSEGEGVSTEWVHVATFDRGRYRCAAVCVGRRVMVLGGEPWRDYATTQCLMLQFEEGGEAREPVECPPPRRLVHWM